MKSLWIVLLLVISSHVRAQNPISVTGLVQDQHGRPLELATLLLLKTADSSLVKGTVSDAQGHYRFEPVAPGLYQVAVTFGERCGSRTWISAMRPTAKPALLA